MRAVLFTSQNIGELRAVPHQITELADVRWRDKAGLPRTEKDVFDSAAGAGKARENSSRQQTDQPQACAHGPGKDRQFAEGYRDGGVSCLPKKHPVDG